MTKAMKTLMLSMATVAISSGIIAGSTYALFSGGASVNNHLEAGNLEVGLSRVEFQEHVLSADGSMETSEIDKTNVDLLTNNNTLFDFKNAVPTSWQRATIEVSNKGNVAFDYGVRLIWNTDSTAPASEVLFAKQIKTTITDSGGTATSFMLNESANKDIKLGYILASGDAQKFDIKAEFIDADNNNDVQKITLDFDMQIYAAQKV